VPRAKRRCPKPDCGQYHPCPVHPQGWASSKSPPLPSNWKVIKKQVKKDGCAHGPLGCSGELELDHIMNRARGGSDGPENLQWLCSHHHRLKTEQERRQGR
jgi:5-methylcytosine-specific restriction protein A